MPTDIIAISIITAIIPPKMQTNSAKKCIRNGGVMSLDGDHVELEDAT